MCVFLRACVCVRARLVNAHRAQVFDGLGWLADSVGTLVHAATPEGECVAVACMRAGSRALCVWRNVRARARKSISNQVRSCEHRVRRHVERDVRRAAAVAACDTEVRAPPPPPRARARVRVRVRASQQQQRLSS